MVEHRKEFDAWIPTRVSQAPWKNKTLSLYKTRRSLTSSVLR